MIERILLFQRSFDVPLGTVGRTKIGIFMATQFALKNIMSTYSCQQLRGTSFNFLSRSLNDIEKVDQQ